MKGSCLHKVQYYETDGMRIVHHSNYMRWFEEARMDCLDKTGFGYAGLEERGIMIPVLSLTCEYKVPVLYGDTVRIDYEVDYFKNVRFGLAYKVFSEDYSVLHAIGSSQHCFLNKDLKPVSIRKSAPDFYAFFNENQ